LRSSGANGYLGNLLRQDDKIVRVRSFADQRLGKLGGIGGHRVARAGEKRIFRSARRVFTTAFSVRLRWRK